MRVPAPVWNQNVPSSQVAPTPVTWGLPSGLIVVSQQVCRSGPPEPGRLGDALVEPPRDPVPVNERQVVEVGEVLGLHVLSTFSSRMRARLLRSVALSGHAELPTVPWKHRGFPRAKASLRTAATVDCPEGQPTSSRRAPSGAGVDAHVEERPQPPVAVGGAGRHDAFDRAPDHRRGAPHGEDLRRDRAAYVEAFGPGDGRGHLVQRRAGPHDRSRPAPARTRCTAARPGSGRRRAPAACGRVRRGSCSRRPPRRVGRRSARPRAGPRRP